MRKETHNSFIQHIVIEYSLWSGHYSRPGEMAVLKSGKIPAFKELIFWWRKTSNKHVYSMKVGRKESGEGS